MPERYQNSNMRATMREGVVRRGKIILESDIHNVIILDQSSIGARARSSKKLNLPSKFELHIDRDTRFRVDLRWVRGFEFGVEFTSKNLIQEIPKSDLVEVRELMMSGNFLEAYSRLRSCGALSDSELQLLIDDAERANKKLQAALEFLIK